MALIEHDGVDADSGFDQPIERWLEKSRADNKTRDSPG